MTHSIPYTHTPRPDTGVSNAQLGMWLFLASDAMFMASLFSGYVLLRTGATTMPAIQWSWMRLLIEGLLLLNVVLRVEPRLVGRSALSAAKLPVRSAAQMLWIVETQIVGCAFLQVIDLTFAGVSPRAHVLVAAWFVLVGTHLVHVVAGLFATMWLANRIDRDDPIRSASRLRVLRLYWLMVAIAWIALVVAFKV